MMKKFLSLILCFMYLLSACAKPKVVEITSVNDNKLNCEGLDLEIFKTEKFKKDAEYAKTGTGGNMSRLIIFWPAWAGSLHNSDKAIKAANDRIFHLDLLKREKNCDKSSNKGQVSVNSLSDELKELQKMYESGSISGYEYEKAKKKLLN